MSTKKIDDSLLIESINCQSEDFLAIELIDFKKPVISRNQTLVFTSKNAVRSLFKHYPSCNLTANKVICVGEKTKQELINNGVTVSYADVSSKHLADWIIKQENSKGLILFCGSLRRIELKEISELHQLNYTEVIVYKTVLTPVKIHSEKDGIIFLSPSAVQSFMVENNMPDAIAFCIGNTTGFEAKKHFKRVEVSEEQSIEKVIVNVNEYYGIK